MLLNKDFHLFVNSYNFNLVTVNGPQLQLKLPDPETNWELVQCAKQWC